jgi:hypothetical protein
MKTRIYYSATCPTCGNGPYSPFRSYDAQGRVVQGCVDEFHTEHLVTPSASSAWHARPAARQLRTSAKQARLGGITHYAR